MGVRSIGLISDPAGVAIGLLRRLTFTGTGVPRENDVSRMLRDQCQMHRYEYDRLREFAARYPNRPEPLEIIAEEQFNGHAWSELLLTGEALMHNFPGQVIGYRMTAAALRELRRFDEAEDVARRAVRRFPQSSEGAAALAHCAGDRGNHSEAERRWDRVARRFPKLVWPPVMRSHSLIALGRIDEADAVASKVARDLPDNLVAWQQYGYVAERREHWEEAARRWLRAIEKFEARPDFRARAAAALRRAGDIDDAEHVIAEAEYMFPRDPGVIAERAEIDRAKGRPAAA
jgi:tetratricopeptide (TPR) repeat protein